METQEALLAFAALSQATRLDVFRLLIEHEPEGLPAGEVARRVAVPANTMSAHLGVLARARLVSAERRSRTIIYRAEIASLRALIDFGHELLRRQAGPVCCADNAASIHVLPKTTG